MIYSLFKSFFNSIGRTLGRIFVYILIAALLIFFSSYINIADVNAEVAPFPGSYNGSDISVSPYVEFYNSNRTLLSSGLGQACETCSPYFSSYLGSANGYLSIGLNQALATDTLYTITLYIGNSNTSPIGTSSTIMSTGTYAEQANNNANNGVCRANIFSWKDTWNGDYYINMGEKNITTGMYFITFTTSCDGGTFINIPLFFGANPSHVYYFGFDLNVLGRTDNLTSSNVQDIINNSNLASANSVEEVKTSVQEVKQEMTELNDAVTSESENFEDSSCGVICKLGKIPGKIIDGLVDGLKSLFIPEDGYFDQWFNDLKTFFEEKLGFLATPFTIFIDFVNMYLDLDASSDIIIDIPDITVPNFEDHKIISSTTFNWSQLLRSKESLNALWQLYLSFIDVYLILNFIGLCESKYNRIFGGDTSTYEYYTVEDSVSYDGQTGEVISRRQNERTTTKRKV